MTLNLTPETQALLEEKMKQFAIQEPNELIQCALSQFGQVRGLDYEDLDTETRAAIDEGERQYQNGEGFSVEQVREKLKSRLSEATGRS